MNLEAIAARLEAQSLGVRGTSIYIHFMPADATGILLRDPTSGTKIDYELPGYRKTSFQLIVRNKAFVEGKTLINAAAAALTLGEALLPNMAIKYMRPTHEPISFPLSAGNNNEFVVNIDACYVIV